MTVANPIGNYLQDLDDIRRMAEGIVSAVVNGLDEHIRTAVYDAVDNILEDRFDKFAEMILDKIDEYCKPK